MKKTIILFATALLFASSAFAQPQLKWYGFIRNYFTYDTHASSAGTEDFFYYMPLNNDEKGTSNFAAITSRLGVDVAGYEVEGYKVGAKIETDFYNKNSQVAVLRLRQAFVTVAKDNRSWKVGQAWHPMAADLPDIFSLESAAPFGAFSRTPQITFDYGLGNGSSLTASAIWMMQYSCSGPEGSSANYIKYSGIPELYLAYNLKSEHNLFRIGADMVNVKPYKKNDGLHTTFNAYIYEQYSNNGWTLKNKLTFAQDGSHFNLIGGYGVTAASVGSDKFDYAFTSNVSDWFTLTCKKDKHWAPALLLGYIKMFASSEEIAPDLFWAKLNAGTVNQLVRVQPEVVYNLGKLAFGAEYMMTSAQYGKADACKAVVDDLHWVTNHRFQLMVKYTF